IAVDHPYQIVQVFAGGQSQRTKSLGFIGFAVPHKSPDAWLVTIGQSACLEITIKAGLVNRQQGSQSHRDGRKLPKIRHEIGMRVRREAGMLSEFLPEILQMLFIQASFDEGPGIDAGRSVALEINHIAHKVIAPGTEEMVEGNLVK